MPGGEVALVSDTVGFVRRLPHELVEAFKSTLEEVAQVDMLVHVVDGSAPDAEQQVEAVGTVLREIGAFDRPELLVVNKLDVADPGVFDDMVASHEGAVAVSAATGSITSSGRSSTTRSTRR